MQVLERRNPEKEFGERVYETVASLFTEFPTNASTPRLVVSVRERRPGEIDSPASDQLNFDGTNALHKVGNEWTVIQQAIAGNTDAQEHLFTRYTSRLYRTAFAVLHNKEDAEDALQDGLCKAYIRLRSFQGRSSFSTWLTRIIVNSALMIRRRKSVHPEASLDEILEGQPARLPRGAVDERPDPEKLCAEAEITALVEEQVRYLPPLLQTAFRLRATRGLSATESSKALGISATALKSRFCRARQKLAGGLQESLEMAGTGSPS